MKKYEEEIKLTIDNLINNIIQTNREKLDKDLILKLLEDKRFHSANQYNSVIKYRLDNILTEIIMVYYQTDITKAYKISKIYNNYNLFEQNIRSIIIHNEGNCCCADKSRYIINCYIKNILEKEVLWEEKKYYIPKIGTSSQWMEFCQSIHELIYGQPENFISKVNEMRV